MQSCNSKDVSSGQCNDCGSTELDTDLSNVCINCGNVLEDNKLDFEFEYCENPSNIGQFISFEDGMAYGPDHIYGSGKRSQVNRIQNARDIMEKLVFDLNLRPFTVVKALNYYKVALNHQLTGSHKSAHVVAACVYMVCREDGTSNMLLDLSCVLMLNVFELGRTYLKLSFELNINFPGLDPITYLEIFAHQLDFGQKKLAVALTAAKLVRRRISDWIPFEKSLPGLCGAALLVAARLHNFDRSIHDVIKIVKFCQATIHKRLSEIGENASAQLAIDLLMDGDLLEEPSSNLHELDDEENIKSMEKDMAELLTENEYAEYRGYLILGKEDSELTDAVFYGLEDDEIIPEYVGDDDFTEPYD